MSVSDFSYAIEAASLDSHPVEPEFLTNYQLKQSVIELTKQNRLQYLENEVIENYLKRTDPDSLKPFQFMLDSLIAKQNRILMLSHVRKTTHIGASGDSATSLHDCTRGRSSTVLLNRPQATTSHGAHSVTMSDTPTINITHKISMVSREMEEVREGNIMFMENVSKAQALHGVKKQQLSLELKEWKSAKEEFLNKVVFYKDHGPKLVYDKYIGFFEKQLRVAQNKICKLRLQRGNLVKTHAQTKIQLEEKIELGESLKATDFQLLENEQVKLTCLYEEVTKNLKEVKVHKGRADSEVARIQHMLADGKKDLQEINRSLKAKEEAAEKFDSLADKIKLEIQKAKDKLLNIRDVRKKYSVPDSSEYLKVKDELFHAQKDLKALSRRYVIQHRNLMFLTAKLQKIKSKKERE